MLLVKILNLFPLPDQDFCLFLTENQGFLVVAAGTRAFLLEKKRRPRNPGSLRCLEGGGLGRHAFGEEAAEVVVCLLDSAEVEAGWASF